MIVFFLVLSLPIGKFDDATLHYIMITFFHALSSLLFTHDAVIHYTVVQAVDTH